MQGMKGRRQVGREQFEGGGHAGKEMKVVAKQRGVKE